MFSTSFKDSGYTTAHSGKWHLYTHSPELDHPLPLADSHNPEQLGFDYWLSHTTGCDRDPESSLNDKRDQFEGDGSEIIVEEALKFISDEVKNGNPIFVVIWNPAPHGPWDASQAGLEPFLQLVDRTSAHAHGEIVAIARSIGFLRRGLKDPDITNNTLIWFTIDNGSSTKLDVRVWPAEDPLGGGGRHGIEIEYPSKCSDEIDHKPTSYEARELQGCIRGLDPDSTGYLRGFKRDFYEGGLRVPTIVEWPAGIYPRTSNFPAGTLDISPTLIEVAPLAPDSINPVHDGISLKNLFASELGRREKPTGFRANGGRMWLDNDWKFLRNVNHDKRIFAISDYKLCNVIGDPVETNNFVDMYPEIADRLKRSLDEWSLSVNKAPLGPTIQREKSFLPTAK